MISVKCLIYRTYLFCSDDGKDLESISYRVSVALSISIGFYLMGGVIIVDHIMNFNLLSEDKVSIYKIVGLGFLLLLTVYSLVKFNNLIDKSVKSYKNKSISTRKLDFCFYGFHIGAVIFPVIVSMLTAES